MVDVLATGCHPDDVEIGMGGTVAKMVRAGLSVGILDLSDGEPTLDGTPEIRAAESERAREALGAEFRTTLDMSNRYIMDSVESRKKVAEVIRQHRPKVIFTHYWDDYHPDHIQGHHIVYAARFYGKLTKTDMAHDPYYTPKIYFYLPVHLHSTIKPSFVVSLEEEDVRTKLLSLQCYESQFGKRLKDLYEYVNSSTRHFGRLIGAHGGEAFVSKEELGVRDIRSLL